MPNRCTSSNATLRDGDFDFGTGLDTWCFGMFESLTLNETELCRDAEPCRDVTYSLNSFGISDTNIVGGLTCETCAYSFRSGIGVF